MRTGKIIAVSLIIVGLGVFIVGVGADYILGGNPGFSGAQIIVILVGLIIFTLGILTISDKRRHSIRRNLGRILLISLPTILLMLIALEIALHIVGFEPYYPIDESANFIEPVPWFMCDAMGCHYDYAARMTACENRLVERSCVINPQGFQDTDNFVASPELDNASVRILALGDSFTFGSSASLGHSYIETVEAEITDSVVWNTGIAATGTGQALAILKAYAPIMQPDIVTLGFYYNDYEDNAYPLDSYFWGVKPDGTILRIVQYDLAPDGTASRVRDMRELFFHAHEVNEPGNNFIYLVGRTAIGSLLLNSNDAIRESFTRPRLWEWEVSRTRTYLTEIRDYTAEHHIKLIILMIPQRDDLVSHTETYDFSLSLFEELNLTVVNPINLLTNDSYAELPDAHWDDDGHTLVGRLLAACIRQLQSREENTECGAALTPASQ